MFDVLPNLLTIINSLSKLCMMANISEQQLVDCTYNRDGCDGGDQRDALTRIARRQFGLDPTSSYPYISGNTSKVCC